MKFIELSNALVVEHGAWVKQTADEMAKAINSIVGKNKEIVVIENEHSFFHKNNLLKALDAVDTKTIQMIAEYRNITITTEELEQATAFFQLRSNLTARWGIASYAYAQVPEKWNFDDNIKINARSISRSGYSVGIKTAKKIWDLAFPIWNGSSEELSASIRLTASGYDRSTNVTVNSVSIGCQTIERFEIEQIAIRMGWVENSSPQI